MVTMTPGNDEAAQAAFAIVSGLIDLLIERNVITKGEITFMLAEIADRLAKEPSATRNRGAEFIRNAVLRQIETK